MEDKDKKIDKPIHELKIRNNVTKFRQEKSKGRESNNFLKESEKIFRKTFDSIPDLIAIIDKNRRIIRVNKAMARKLGIKGQDLIGKYCYDAVHGTKESPAYCPHTPAIKDGKEHIEEVYDEKLKGNYLFSATPLFDEKENCIGVVEVARDITKIKEAEKKIQDYAKELEESNRLKDLFSDIMRHDLLNPIGVIYGYVGLLSTEETDPDKKEILSRINDNLTRAGELVEDAKRLSRLESLNTIKYKKIDFKELMDTLIEDFTPLANNAEMEIENKISGDLPLMADEIIGQVFANLISNAIKYSKEGKRIIVNAEEMESLWRITVTDFGEGIEDKFKSAIFERFYRKDKMGVKGSGMGLAIAKKITELHKGKIWVEDNPKGGSVFVVELPKNLNLNVEKK